MTDPARPNRRAQTRRRTERRILAAAEKVFAQREAGSAPCVGSSDAEIGCEANVDWLATVRVVLGWQIGRTMPYLTAGLTVGSLNGFADLGACGYVGACGYDETRTGWTAGIGVRHELTDRWALKGDILHVDLGEPEFTASSVTGSGFDFNQIRLGAIYKF